MVQRVKTGIKGFDELVEGGFPQGSTVAVIGTPGSGKTIFSLEYLYRGAEKGERGLYVSFKQSVDSLQIQSEQFNWSVKGFERKNLLKFMKVDGLDLIQVIFEIEKEVKSFRPKRVVIDSMSDVLDYLPTLENMKKLGITAISEESDSESKELPIAINRIAGLMKEPSVLRIAPRDTINRIASVFIDRIRRLGVTTIFIADSPQQGENLTKDGVTEFASDGVVSLHAIPGEEAFNTLNVVKMRLTKVKRGIYNFEFGPSGITVKTGE